MNFPSRRERRALAKKMGLVPSNETVKQWTERTRRAKELGERINMMHLEKNVNQNNSTAKMVQADWEWKPNEEVNFEIPELLPPGEDESTQ